MARQGAKRGRGSKEGLKKGGGRLEERRGGRGPRLDSSLLKQIDGGRKKEKKGADEDGLVVKDLYEYEEGVAEEEAGKNRRFDAVDQVEYELPSDFEDEEIDEDAALGEEDEGLEETINTKKRRVGKSEEDELDLNSEEEDLDQEEDEEDEEDEAEEEEDEEEDDEADEKHQQMLEAVTGKSREARQESARERKRAVRSEAYTESEYNINPDGNGRAASTNNVTVEDLLGSLQGASGIGSLKKRMLPLQREKQPMNVPLPKVIQERVERKVGYEKSRDEVTKWQSIVKSNRQASTLTFNEREAGVMTTVAALADKFKPVNDMEKEVAMLLEQSKLEMKKENLAAEALELNKLSVEEVRERTERLSKMRSLLFQHEAKAKRVGKIKSKTFRRLDKDKKMRDFKETDEEAVKEASLKQESKRAEERMTLKHKNTSRWAKRILKRGLKAHEDGTRDAIMEQLRAHSMLTKKIQSATMSSSDESSSEEEGEGEEGAAPGRKGRILAKAKAATFEALQFDAEAEVPKSGLFALPFMARAMEKKRNEAREEAVAVLEQLEQAEADDEAFNGDRAGSTREDEVEGAGHSGRLAFGDLAVPSLAENTRKKSRTNHKEMDNEDCEDFDSGFSVDEEDDDIDDVAEEKVAKGMPKKGSVQKTAVSAGQKKADRQGGQKSRAKVASEDQSHADSDRVKTSAEELGASGRDDADTLQDLSAMIAGFKKTATGVVQVSTFNKQLGFRKSKPDTPSGGAPAKSGKVTKSQGDVSRANVSQAAGLLELEDKDDSAKDTGLELVGRDTSQQELIRRAFAGDDVEADFQDIKTRAMEEEVVRVEESKTLPGWGQWTHVQKKRVEPGWKADIAQKNREAALKRRKDAKLQFVIISEKLDKKGAKYCASKVPFPMKSKEVFEKTMRMPIGREYNSEKVFRDMIRPAELRNAGIIIDPIKQNKREAVETLSHVVKRRRERLQKGSK